MFFPFAGLLLPAILDIARADPGSPVAELVVRIDDRHTRTLKEPWVTVEYDSGTQIQAEVLDDGQDPEDAIARDHLYVRRVPLPDEGMVQIWISDGVLAQAVLLRKVRTNVRRGAKVRLLVGGGERLGRSHSPGAAQMAGPSGHRDGGRPQGTATADDDVGGTSSRGQPHEPAYPPELLPPRRSTRTPIRVNLVPWPLQVWLWPTLVVLLGLGLWRGIRETSRRPLTLARDLTDLLERKSQVQPEGPRIS